MAVDQALAPAGATLARPARSRRVFAVVVFTLTFALLLSDFMSRQVLTATFPLLKTEFGLSDTRLATLNSVVSLMVAVLAIPFSILGDRYGRTRAVVLMAVVWALATIGSGLASSYDHLLLARLFVGAGEAAYGSIGLAVLLSVFAASLRSTMSAAFLAGGTIGSVLGVAVGGVLAEHAGWRSAFHVMGIAGLVLAVVYALVVSEGRLARLAHPDEQRLVARERARGERARLRSVFSTRSVNLAYVACGLQLSVAGMFYAWTPSWFNREYGLSVAAASAAAGGIIALIAVGMTLLGYLTDRLARDKPDRKWTCSMVYVVVSCVALVVGFRLPHGPAQLIAVCIGAFFCAGITGPTGAMVTRLTAPSVRSGALATWSVANNLLGLALGPLIVGRLADAIGLTSAMGMLPLLALVVLPLLVLGRRAYPAGLAKVGLQPIGKATR
ncbi:MFS transporter [Flexivirga meconopsidis]|uniref:MFS transporter n=1 Tax=Flexivirga meconopsidis TaxID=2977121 RepID=UPI00223F0740|nr:MFS transporter [Flexivirga meconopsidis]